MVERFISSKPYKQWCKARRIDFISYINQFPFVVNRLNITKREVVQPKIQVETPQEVKSMRKETFWHRLVKEIKTWFLKRRQKWLTILTQMRTTKTSKQ